MRRGAGSPAWVITRVSALLSAPNETPGVACSAVCRMPADSRKYFHANTMLSAQNTAAPNPGPRCPHQRTNNEPNAGPTTAPALVAEDSQPNPFARSSGLLAPATYACSTQTVPQPPACTTPD